MNYNECNINDLLKKYWGYADFRPLQEDIIHSVIEGNDTLGLMPTGGGKSITFQIPALAKKGTCIVITPLIALMKDQVENIRKKGIKAAAIYSGMPRTQIIQELDNCILGDYKFLYLSPERLSTDLFIKKIRDIDVNLIAVDEAHCISQWGYDFRPQYLQIADLRLILPENIPILALTATATPEVVEDIQKKLNFRKGSKVFKKSFGRKNLAYVVKYTDDKLSMLLRILNNVPGTSIVYVRNRAKTKEISDFLNQNEINSDYFHAGLSNETKDKRQIAWKNDECRVIVSTNAFGMGIDKPNVRTVIHMELPDTLEAYFQEAGRAGRDGEKAYAILLYSDAEEKKLNKRISDTFPEKEFILQVYDKLFNYFQIAEGEGSWRTFKFSVGEFCSIYHFSIIQTESALKILQQEGHLEYNEEPEARSRIVFTMYRDDLYHLETNKDEDTVLFALMRNYEGIFSDYVFINESFLCKQTGFSREKMYSTLIKLRQLGAINYIPQKKEPEIIIKRGRIDIKKLTISKENYETRKEQYIKRIHSVIDYAKDKEHCRSQKLLYYFGEKFSNKCCICDTCLKQKKEKEELISNEFEDIRETILSLINSVKNKPTLEQLQTTLVAIDEDKLNTVIRWMLDCGEMKIKGDETLQIIGLNN